MSGNAWQTLDSYGSGETIHETRKFPLKATVTDSRSPDTDRKTELQHNHFHKVQTPLQVDCSRTDPPALDKSQPVDPLSGCSNVNGCFTPEHACLSAFPLFKLFGFSNVWRRFLALKICQLNSTRSMNPKQSRLGVQRSSSDFVL